MTPGSGSGSTPARTRYYQLKVGRDVRDRSGIEWIDDVVLRRRRSRPNPAGGGLLDTADSKSSCRRVELQRGPRLRPALQLQGRAGRAPAFSAVVRLDRALIAPAPSTSSPESTEVLEAMYSTLADVRARRAPSRAERAPSSSRARARRPADADRQGRGAGRHAPDGGGQERPPGHSRRAAAGGRRHPREPIRSRASSRRS